MKRIGVVCTLLVFITLVIPSSVLSLGSGMEINEVVDNNDSSLSLAIEGVFMVDYNVVCSMLGGQYVSIGVLVGNQGDEDFNGTFNVKIFTDQVSYLEQQNVTEQIGSGHSRLVSFQNVHISEEIGEHTLDAYINDNISTRNYCEFEATLIGIDTLNVVDSCPENNNRGEVSIAQIYLKLDKTITVDDDGGADYTRIQDAIDNASDGDTIFVFSGTYHENLYVNKILNLIGEDRDSTIIDGENKDDVIIVFEDNVKIEKFSIRNCKNYYGFSGVNLDSNNNFLLDCNIYDNYWGVLCYGDDNHISNNNIFGNRWGIMLSGANQNMIDSNRISENYGGIYVCRSDGNIIVENEILNHNSNNYPDSDTPGEGIIVEYSDDNVISLNNISSNEIGLTVVYSDNHDIFNNNIENNNLLGIRLDLSRNCNIYENNFIHNGRSKFIISKMLFLGSIIGDYSIFKSKNKWDSNYWDRPRFLPFRIFGFVTFNATITGFVPILFPFYQFDWRPAKKPYDIPSYEVIKI